MDFLDVLYTGNSTTWKVFVSEKTHFFLFPLFEAELFAGLYQYRGIFFDVEHV